VPGTLQCLQQKKTITKFIQANTNSLISIYTVKQLNNTFKLWYCGIGIAFVALQESIVTCNVSGDNWSRIALL